MIDVALLARMGPCKKFASGQRIPCPGCSAGAEREMYILVSGRVDVFKASAAGGTKTVASLLPGDVFGGREFFTDIDDCVYTAGIDSIVYVISENSFNELSWTQPEILFEVLKAAYMPLRKMSASEKTAIATAAQGATEKVKVVRKHGTKDNAAPMTKSKAAGQAGTPEQTTAFSMQDTSVALAEGEIFPGGHKLYPGVIKPEFTQLVFPKDYDCPYCKKPFKSYKVFRSKLYESSPMRYDLRKYYSGFQTEWYDVITCSNCLFSTIYNYFTEPKPLQKKIIAGMLDHARASILLDFEAERNIDFVFAAHYLALMCSEGYLSLGRQIRAKLWGNLSWLYEDVGDEEMARFAANKAAEAYESVYAETHLTPVQEQITCLSIAGMQYRAGVDRNLKKFLFTAKTVKMGDKTYAKLAEDFMYELRIEDD